MKSSKFSIYSLAILLIAGMIMFSCGKDDTGGDTPDPNPPVVPPVVPPTTNEEIEALALSAKWNNYLEAAAEELYEDCVRLYAAWAGPDALTEEEEAIIGAGFYAELNAPAGYAAIVKNPAEASEYGSASAAIEGTIVQGSIDIAGEVGEQKIGGPNALAKAGETTQAVLEVESWYSFNSLDDYANNIVSIRNSYFGGIDATEVLDNSLAAFVTAADPDLNDVLVEAITSAYNAIGTMDKPFRNNLAGSKVDAAIDACADLADIFETQLIPFVQRHDDEDAYTAILQTYADDIVVETYRNMKDKAKDLRDAVRKFTGAQSQNNLNDACNAWRATRIPWEQSESFLYGPADLLGLDPSLDSWPLDQGDILTILKDSKQSVDDIRGEINNEAIRGFHTIELLLFQGGEPRTVK
ncbi:MAG: hypothetical protein LBI58_01660 [Tannerellaceae bacterium]|jgi:predicted lipoprotein|nr:hypothetical protein [Tannerellaceae bacterium]